jgi:dTDP-4-dehydrorhamnose reductase
VGSDARIVVTGAAGQVGTALRKFLPEARYLTRADADVTDPQGLKIAFEGGTAIIHLAALTDVDACERDPATADRVNAQGTANVVAEARGIGARVVYVSTDYVFDGTQDGPYYEDDAPSPINAYGRSKLLGEHAVQTASDGLVVRTSWVYGAGRNFVRTIIKAARARSQLVVVDDQRGRPTSAEDLAAAIAHLLATGATGTVNVSGDGSPCSWADLAEAALTAAAIPAAVERTDSGTYASRQSQVVAPRPPNSVLALDKAKGLGVPLRDWRRSVAHYARDLR